jgi:glycosyltransferase involved in cell wall biosynthesis
MPALSPNLSVIICTHNPRPDYLRRTLAALEAQSLPRAQWELLLIDNASERPLAQEWNLSWHPRARHVPERELGLTPARLRGIRESAGDLLVLVDDDNVLAADYLSAAAALFARREDLGVASGRLLPEYETPPPPWFRPYESWIAVRRLDASRWSNFFDPRAEPCGAGMCVRKDIALRYAARASASAGQRILDRRGGSLLSGGDVAITKVAMGLGYSMGQFVDLNATHLIPSRRVSEAYLFNLYRNLQASGQLLGWLENAGRLPRPNWRVYAKAFLRFLRGGQLERRLVWEEFRAVRLARAIAREATAAQPAMTHAASLEKS